ncbi:MAG: CoA pyrophosphatase, partial [Gemmatimonadetes bacterium]|nr:CoA pyrophosphatase [Gemmatimonadota bacterium]
MNTFQRIAAALSAYQPSIRSETDKTQAAVAAVFHPRRDDLYLLFIERATHPTDPWSGHIAFPGGTAEPDDSDLKYTAERETREELGLDLSNAQYLGRLDDVTGATLPIQVACFVYAIFEGVEVAPNDEV